MHFARPSSQGHSLDRRPVGAGVKVVITMKMTQTVMARTVNLIAGDTGKRNLSCVHDSLDTMFVTAEAAFKIFEDSLFCILSL